MGAGRAAVSAGADIVRPSCGSACAEGRPAGARGRSRPVAAGSYPGRLLLSRLLTCVPVPSTAGPGRGWKHTAVMAEMRADPKLLPKQRCGASSADPDKSDIVSSAIN